MFRSVHVWCVSISRPTNQHNQRKTWNNLESNLLPPPVVDTHTSDSLAAQETLSQRSISKVSTAISNCIFISTCSDAYPPFILPQKAKQIPTNRLRSQQTKPKRFLKHRSSDQNCIEYRCLDAPRMIPRSKQNYKQMYVSFKIIIRSLFRHRWSSLPWIRL